MHTFKATFSKTLFLTGTILSLFSCQQIKKKEQLRPNIIFILADDLGYNDVGYAGQKSIETPHIDQLATEGKVYTDCYAGAPVCGPSRSVLMTGQHTGHTTLRGNTTIKGGLKGKKGKKTLYRANLAADDYTVGNVMQDAGYATCLVGKWHLGGFDPKATPLDRGFDEFYGWLINKPQTYASTYWPDKRMKNQDLISIPENENGKKGYYHTDMCTDEAIDYLQKHKNAKDPFLLMLCYSNPHAPLDAPNNDRYADKDWPEDMKTYASMISHLDKSIERIKQSLIKEGLDKNTIVFFCSDNGPRSNPSESLTNVVDFFDSNGELRGYKRDMYEGGIRTPMIAWSPKLIQAGTVSDLPWYFADIMPTFAGIGNHTSDKMQTDGIDISPSLLGKPIPTTDRFLYWEFFEKGYKQAVRYGKWKAVIIKGKLELFDLTKDIGEQNNIAEQHPDVVQTIETYLTTCRTDSPMWPVQ